MAGKYNFWNSVAWNKGFKDTVQTHSELRVNIITFCFRGAEGPDESTRFLIPAVRSDDVSLTKPRLLSLSPPGSGVVWGRGPPEGSGSDGQRPHPALHAGPGQVRRAAGENHGGQPADRRGAQGHRLRPPESRERRTRWLTDYRESSRCVVTWLVVHTSANAMPELLINE